MDSNTVSNSTSTYETSSNQPEGWEDHRFISPADLKLMLKETHVNNSEEYVQHILQSYTLLFPVLRKSFELKINSVYDLVLDYFTPYGVDIRNPPQIMHDLIEMRKLKEKEKEEKQKLKEENENDLTRYFYDPKSDEFMNQILNIPHLPTQDKKDMLKQYTQDYKKLFSKKATPLWVLSAGVDLYHNLNLSILPSQYEDALENLLLDSDDEMES